MNMHSSHPDSESPDLRDGMTRRKFLRKLSWTGVGYCAADFTGR